MHATATSTSSLTFSSSSHDYVQLLTMRQSAADSYSFVRSVAQWPLYVSHRLESHDCLVTTEWLWQWVQKERLVNTEMTWKEQLTDLCTFLYHFCHQKNEEEQRPLVCNIILQNRRVLATDEIDANIAMSRQWHYNIICLACQVMRNLKAVDIAAVQCHSMVIAMPVFNFCYDVRRLKLSLEALMHQCLVLSEESAASSWLIRDFHEAIRKSCRALVRNVCDYLHALMNEPLSNSREHWLTLMHTRLESLSLMATDPVTHILRHWRGLKGGMDCSLQHRPTRSLQTALSRTWRALYYSAALAKRMQSWPAFRDAVADTAKAMNDSFQSKQYRSMLTHVRSLTQFMTMQVPPVMRSSVPVDSVSLIDLEDWVRHRGLALEEYESDEELSECAEDKDTFSDIFRGSSGYAQSIRSSHSGSSLAVERATIATNRSSDQNYDRMVREMPIQALQVRRHPRLSSTLMDAFSSSNTEDDEQQAWRYEGQRTAHPRRKNVDHLQRILKRLRQLENKILVMIRTSKDVTR